MKTFSELTKGDYLYFVETLTNCYTLRSSHTIKIARIIDVKYTRNEIKLYLKPNYGEHSYCIVIRIDKYGDKSKAMLGYISDHNVFLDEYATVIQSFKKNLHNMPYGKRIKAISAVYVLERFLKQKFTSLDQIGRVTITMSPDVICINNGDNVEFHKNLEIYNKQ